MKAKIFQVSIDGETYLVEALTQAGAIRDAVGEVCGGLRARAVVDLATGEQLYEAGISGAPIIGSEKYKQGVDPNQLMLPCVPETAGTVGG